MGKGKYSPDAPGKHTNRREGVFIIGHVIVRDAKHLAYFADGGFAGVFSTLEDAHHLLRNSCSGRVMQIDFSVAGEIAYRAGAVFAAHHGKVDEVLSKYIPEPAALSDASVAIMAELALNERSSIFAVLKLCGASEAEAQAGADNFAVGYVAGSTATGGRA